MRERDVVASMLTLDAPLPHTSIFPQADVNGPNAHPLYAALKKYEPELSGYPPKISWNFEKFLIGPDGTPLRRYRPGVDPLEVEPDIKVRSAKGWEERTFFFLSRFLCACVRNSSQSQVSPPSSQSVIYPPNTFRQSIILIWAHKDLYFSH